jgi:hypothetical protein
MADLQDFKMTRGSNLGASVSTTQRLAYKGGTHVALK